MARVPLPLPETEAHVWHLDMDRVRNDAALLSEYEVLLTPEERGRRDRFYFPEGRLQYLLTRALVRTVLSAYAADVPPDAWRFAANEHGRPHLTTPHPVAGLNFNLSNTDRCVVCVVANGLESGVDVEFTSRRGETVKIADRYFAGSEVAELLSRPEALQRDRFFDYWTLKEAYIKAKGKGLAISLSDFAFALVDGEPIRISFTPELPDAPERWQFQLVRLTEDHRLAVALERGRRPDLRVEIRPALPLRGALG